MSDFRVGNPQRTEVLALLSRALDAHSLPVPEYDRRVVAVGSATYASELAAQLQDLPTEFSWQPNGASAAGGGRPGRRHGRTAVILGLLSLPLSACVAGWIFGILAIVYARRGGPVRGSTAATTGVVTGILGIVLSVAAALALMYALRHHVTP